MSAHEAIGAAFERLVPLLPIDPSLMTDDQLISYTGAVEAVARCTDALRLRAARELDQRSDPTLGDESLARKLGHKSVAGALELVTRTSAEDARKRVAEGRNLAKLPVIDAAVEHGALGRAQALEIMQPLLPTLRVAATADVETACVQLVELAAAVPASAVKDAAQLWAAVLDPDGIEPDERSAVEKRFVRLGRAKDGLVKLTGMLPVEQAAAIRAVLDAYNNPRAGVSFAPAGGGADEAETADSRADAPGLTPPTDSRTIEQKNADIFHAVFAGAARAPETPMMGGAHPTILVTVAGDDLESGRGAAWVDGETEPISARAAARIACGGGLQEVELGAKGEVLNLGRTERCFSPAQRRVLAVRDKGCVIPGCPIPARWAEAHHVENWQHGGPTDVINAALLCWWHHFTIDDGPWQLRMVDGRPEVRWVFGSHASPWVKAVHTPPRHSPPHTLRPAA
jgi:hypothetical protein